MERPDAPDMITTRELQVLKEVKLLMQPFEDLTKKISDEKFAIISKILPLINCTTNAITNIHTATQIGNYLKKNILFELNR